MQLIQQGKKGLSVKVLAILLAVILTVTPFVGAVTPADPYVEAIPADYYVEAEPVEEELAPEAQASFNALSGEELVALAPLSPGEIVLNPIFMSADAAANLEIHITPPGSFANMLANAPSVANMTDVANVIQPDQYGRLRTNQTGWHVLFVRGILGERATFHQYSTHFYVSADMFLPLGSGYLNLPIESNRRSTPAFPGVHPQTGTRHPYETHASGDTIIRLGAINDRYSRSGNWSVLAVERDEYGNRLPGQTWALGSDVAPWRGPNYFQTPAMRNQVFCDDTGILTGLVDPNRSIYAFTTRPEKWAFYEELLASPVNGANMYVFNAGYSPHNFAHVSDPAFFRNDFVVFTSTDLSDVSCWTEAGALVQDNGRPTLFTYTGTHGHEQSSQEGALALAYALAATPWGVEMLEDVNVVLYLGVNGTGNHQMQRRVSTVPGVQRAADPNRDFTLLFTQEVRQLHRVWLAFMPEVTVDGHEIGTPSYNNQGWTGSTGSMADDHQIQITATRDVDPRIVSLGSSMLQRNFDDGRDAGLRFGYYNTIIVNAMVGNHFFGMWGGISMIFETAGQSSQNLMRRAYSTYASYRSLLEYLRENADQIHDTVADVRADLIVGGRTYAPTVDLNDPTTLIIRDQQRPGGAPGDTRFPAIPRWAVGRGGQYNLVNPAHLVPTATNVQTITRPTAYIVPMEIDWDTSSNLASDPPNPYSVAIQDLRTMLGNHGVEYYILDPEDLPADLALQQFFVSSANVTPRTAAFTTGLRPLADTTFDVPVMFIPMDQMAGHMIGIIMTPDMRVFDRESATGSLSWVQSLQNADGYGASSGTHRLDRSRTLLHNPADGNALPIFRLLEENPRIFMGVDPLVVSFEDAPTVIRRNQRVELKAVVAPAYAPQDVIFTSSNPALATVDADGLVTARAASGIVVITARTPCGTARASITLRLSA